MSRFTARSPDGRAEWEVVRDYIRTEHGNTPGRIAPYSDLHTILRRDEDERHAVQQAGRRASAEMLIRDHRCLVAVPGEGYRVAAANEHVHIGTDKEKRGTRQFRRAVKVYDSTPLEELTEAER